MTFTRQLILALAVGWCSVATAAESMDASGAPGPILGVSVALDKSGTVDDLRAFDNELRTKEATKADLRCNGCDGLGTSTIDPAVDRRLRTLTYTFPVSAKGLAAAFAEAWQQAQGRNAALKLQFDSDPPPIPTCDPPLSQPCYVNIPCRYPTKPASNGCSKNAYPGSCTKC